jgi:hypothetical protein
MRDWHSSDAQQSRIHPFLQRFEWSILRVVTKWHFLSWRGAEPFDETSPSSVEALRVVSEVEPRRSNLHVVTVQRLLRFARLRSSQTLAMTGSQEFNLCSCKV